MKQDYKIPDWLTDAYLLRVLRSNASPTDKIVLNKCDIESATNKGDNYSSEMFRIFLQYTRNGERKEKRIILKKDHDNKEVNEVFQKYNLYTTEIDYYRLYMPEFEKILSEAGENIKLSPRMIFYEDPVFIMEDMAPLNFRTANREDRLTWEMAKMVLAKLAKYHASSMVYNLRTGDSLVALQNRLFDVEEGFLAVMLKKFDILGEDMKSWGPEYASIIPKLRYVRENYYEIQRKVVVPAEGQGVFIHGDYWMNNILIQFDGNKPVDVLLIDLQVSSWSTPAYDLLYFMFTSLNEDVYQERFDELIKWYYDNMSGILKKLNHPTIPTLMQLHQEIQSKLIHSLFGGVLIKSIIYAVDSDSADVKSVLEKKGSRDATFENERFRGEMKYLMKFLDNRGAFDNPL